MENRIKIKKLNVSVGIPAHNEEKNIQKLLKDILKQEKSGWYLKEILVYCDGCTDQTAEKTAQVKSKLIKIFIDGQRRGKSYRLGQMLKKFSGDILILFDADLKLGNKNVITNLLSGFEDPEVMIVSGNKKPFLPKNFIEKGIYSTFEVFYESKIKVRGGNNIFGCQGGLYAVRKKFAKSVILPEVISDDAFLYLSAISKGFKFKYVDNSVVYYKLASNLSDYLKQLFRATPESVNIFLNKLFGDRVKQEFHRPLSLYAMSIIKVFMKRPLPTLFIIMVNLLTKPFIPVMAKKYIVTWPTATSTK